MKYLCCQGKEMPGGANADAPPLFVDCCLLIVIQRTTGTIPDQFWKSPFLLKKKFTPSTEYVLILCVVAIAQLFL